MTIIVDHGSLGRWRWPMKVGWHRRRVLMAVRRWCLPSATADSAEAPAALGSRRVGEKAGTSLAGASALLDLADRYGAIEH